MEYHKEGARTARVRPIPEGYHAVTPYLCIQGAASAIEFYKRAFGAREVMRLGAPEGKIGHAEIAVSDSRIMLADEYPEMNFRSPRSIGGSPVHIHLYVDDVDSTAGRRRQRESAETGGGSVLRRPERQPGGSFWARVACRNPQGRPLCGGNRKAGRRTERLTSTGRKPMWSRDARSGSCDE